MNAFFRNALLSISLPILTIGCRDSSAPKSLEDQILEQISSEDFTIRGYSPGNNLESLTKFLEEKKEPEPVVGDKVGINLGNSPQFLYVILRENGKPYLAEAGSCNVITPDGFAITNEHVVERFCNSKDGSLIFFDPVRNIYARTNVLAYSKKIDLALVGTDVPKGTYNELPLAPKEQSHPSISYAVALENPLALMDEFMEHGSDRERLKDRKPTRTFAAAGMTVNNIYDAANTNNFFVIPGQRLFIRDYEFTDAETGKKFEIEYGNSGSGVFTQGGFYQGPLSMSYRKKDTGKINEGPVAFVSPTALRSFISRYISGRNKR